MAVRRSPIIDGRASPAEEGRALTPKPERPPGSRSNARPTPSPPARTREREVIKFYTIAEVADCLNVSTRTVRRWIRRRLLVAHQPGGLVRIAEADLRLFLALHRDA
jgi:excisionase family DNA binding protein